MFVNFHLQETFAGSNENSRSLSRQFGPFETAYFYVLAMVMETQMTCLRQES